MGTIKTLEDLDAWQAARGLVRRVYEVSNQGPFASDFGLRDQLRRAAVSAMGNIAEGFERDGAAEFAQFLAIAKGSAGEVRSGLYVAWDVGYIDEATFRELHDATLGVARLVAGLTNYLRNSGLRGLKFR